MVCKNSVQPVGLRDPHVRRLSRIDLGFEIAEQLQDECSFFSVHAAAAPSRLVGPYNVRPLSCPARHESLLFFRRLEAKWKDQSHLALLTK